jgi:hypothetical protein
MSASRCWPAVLLIATGLVNAEDADEMPDAEFLEYLGMWEDSDDEWTLFEGEPFAREGAADDGEDGKDRGAQDDAESPDDASPEMDDEA